MTAPETKIEWRMTYFPPHGFKRVAVGPESYIRRMADIYADWNPVLERHTIITTPWEVVQDENP